MSKKKDSFPLTSEQWRILRVENARFVEMYAAGRVPGLRECLPPEAVRLARKSQTI